MKKLIVVAAVAMAAYAQAASINWGGFVSNDARGDATAQAGTVFNAIFIGTKDYSSQLSTLNYDMVTGLVGTGLGSAFTALEGQTLLGTHTLTSEEAGNWAFVASASRADADGGVNGNWLMTMFDASSPDTFWVGQYAVSGASDSTGAIDITDTSWTIGVGTHGAVTSSSAVPEPTSGLLLLIGVAGLALRRRRA